MPKNSAKFNPVYIDLNSDPTAGDAQDEMNTCDHIKLSYPSEINPSHHPHASVEEKGTDNSENLSESQKNKLLEVAILINRIYCQPLPSFDILNQPLLGLRIKDYLFQQQNSSEQLLDQVNSDFQENIDLGVPPTLKDYIRTLGEGSSDPLDTLAEKINLKINQDSELTSFHPIATKEKLKSVIPIFLNRKRFGIQKDSTFIKKFEDDTKENLWVWEAPSLDIFPAEIREKTKEAREDRQRIRRKLKALHKKRESLLANDITGEAKADEQLHSIARKELEIKEKKSKLMIKQKELEQKLHAKKNDQTSFKENKDTSLRPSHLPDPNLTPEIDSNNFKALTSNKKPKKRDQDLPPIILPNDKNFKENKTLKVQQDWMLRWLQPSQQKHSNPPPSILNNDSISNIDSPLHSLNPMHNNHTPSPLSQVNYEDWTGTSLTKSHPNYNWLERIRNMPQYSQPAASSLSTNFELTKKKDLESSKDILKTTYLQEFINNFALPHMKKLKDLINVYKELRAFYLEIPTIEGDGDFRSSEMPEEEVYQGLTSSSYYNENYTSSPFIRTVYINDNEWKRPSRHLLINSIPNNMTFIQPYLEEIYLDYDIDSDEEWFEIFDVDDLDDAKEEEEEEEEIDEDDDNFIVPDENFGPPPDDQIIFESSLDWEWIFEGQIRSSNRLIDPANPELNINPKDWHSIFGTVQDEWNGNPFLRVDNELTIPKGILNEKDIIELFKHCHGKQIPKQMLIEEFRLSNTSVFKADIERKFKQYLVYEKRGEDKKAAWWVKEEAINLYNLNKSIQKIQLGTHVLADENFQTSVSVSEEKSEILSSPTTRNSSNHQTTIRKTIDNSIEKKISFQEPTLDSVVVVEIDSTDDLKSFRNKNTQIPQLEHKRFDQDFILSNNHFNGYENNNNAHKNLLPNSSVINDNKLWKRSYDDYLRTSLEKEDHLSMLSCIQHDESIDQFDSFENSLYLIDEHENNTQFSQLKNCSSKHYNIKVPPTSSEITHHNTLQSIDQIPQIIKEENPPSKRIKVSKIELKKISHKYSNECLSQDVLISNYPSITDTLSKKAPSNRETKITEFFKNQKKNSYKTHISSTF